MSILEDQNISRKDNSRLDYQYEPVAGFEKLWVWQKAHKLMLEIHEICKKLHPSECYQIKKSSSSVPDNIAEGRTSYYYQDKIKGFNIARKESGEAQNQIRSFQGKKYITQDRAIGLIKR